MIRLLTFEAAAFVAAALVHFGIIPLGLEDSAAGTAESIIAVVLLIGVGISRSRRAWTRRVALLTQGFALAGTLIGLYLFVTIEPDKVADIVYHLLMVVVLITGIVLAMKLPRNTVNEDTEEVTR